MIAEVDAWLVMQWDDGVVVFDTMSGDTHLAPAGTDLIEAGTE